MLSSLHARRQARVWARLHGKLGGLRDMSEFQLSATELALLHRRSDRRPGGRRGLRRAARRAARRHAVRDVDLPESPAELRCARPGPPTASHASSRSSRPTPLPPGRTSRQAQPGADLADGRLRSSQPPHRILPALAPHSPSPVRAAGAIVGGVDELSPANALLGDAEALRRRLARDGYLFFRGLLPAEQTRAAADSVRAALRRGGWIDDRGTPRRSGARSTRGTRAATRRSAPPSPARRSTGCPTSRSCARRSGWSWGRRRSATRRRCCAPSTPSARPRWPAAATCTRTTRSPGFRTCSPPGCR